MPRQPIQRSHPMLNIMAVSPQEQTDDAAEIRIGDLTKVNLRSLRRQHESRP